MDAVTAAVIGVIISAFGITGGFVYNARSIQQNTRTRYYQIQKDLETEYHALMELERNIESSRMVRVNNFAIFLIKLVNREMIPKEYLIPYYDDIFSEALWNRKIFFSGTIQRGGLKKEFEILDEFCKENKIDGIDPNYSTEEPEKDTK